jgi:hypothetical protein
MIIFNIGYYVVFTYLPTYFIKTLQFSKTSTFVSITLASLVALILILPLAAHCVLAAIEAVHVSTALAAGVELFATRVRYRGFSIGYNICVAAFGGTTPYVVTWLTADGRRRRARLLRRADRDRVAGSDLDRQRDRGPSAATCDIGPNVPIRGVTVSGCRRPIPQRGRS